MKIVLKILLIIVVIFVCISVLAVIMALRKQKKMNNYKELYKGMPLKEALNLMGNDFRKEENSKYTTYIWTINSKHYKGVNDVRIRVKDDKVTEILKFQR